ncbi:MULTISPECIES: porin [Cupriavidus]|jgi:Outer membrane protein (porin)|uniref:Porin n=1 Tax=Cupriavidus cauae TaxID=2608999 RepID=A0A5M8AXW5_9BURK|nr:MULTISPECIES: porin [Cupriavidus]KAA0179180.1 porin [Cupriavidus gilardii]KAA6128627.1 porin [Cupriavidus cauae]MCA7086624.1 porin [Cupriavidus sp. DB3]
MKMKLFAAAVAALAAGGAYAQSSVTLYGVVDAGIEYNNNAGPNGDNLFRMQSGGQSGSRWGLRGVEDLGGGLKGLFVLESGFDIDTGRSGQDNRLFGRAAYVGLQNQFGTLTLGRQQTVMYDFGLQFDPMAIAPRYSITSIAPEFQSRADNTVKYVGKFGGLTASAMYSFRNEGQEEAGAFRRGQEYGALLSYAAGPFAVGAAYDETHGTTVAVPGAPAGTVVDASGRRIRRATVAGSYAFGPAKAFVGYRWAKAADGAVLPGAPSVDNSTSNLYWAGLAYQLTPAFSVTGAAYYQDFRRTGADPWQFALTGDYALSKRTDIYASVSYALNKDGSQLGVAGYGPANVQADKDQIGAIVGVRHKF